MRVIIYLAFLTGLAFASGEDGQAVIDVSKDGSEDRLLCQNRNTNSTVRPRFTQEQLLNRVANVQKRLDNFNTYLVSKKMKYLNTAREELADPFFYEPEAVGVVSLRNVDKVEYLVWHLEEADSEYRNLYWKHLIKWGRTKEAPKYRRKN